MKHDILRNVLSLFNESVTQTIANRLAERHPNVIDALERIIPAILRGFASRTQESPETAAGLLQLASEANSDSWWQTEMIWITDDDKMQKGHEMLQQIFGNYNIDSIGGQVAQKTMIRISSAVKLMQWSAPICLGVIGKEATEANYDATTLADWLLKEPFEIEGEGLPGGIKTTTVPAYTGYAKKKKSKNNLVAWAPLLLLLLLGASLWWYMKGRSDEQVPTQNLIAKEIIVAQTEEKIDSSQTKNQVHMRYAGLPAYTIAEDSTVTFQYDSSIDITLPDSSNLIVAANGAEVMLLTRIWEAMEKGISDVESDSSDWVNLYDVQFTEGTTYRVGAEQQLRNVAAILHAFPTVKIKIGGYTDNAGSDKDNAKISKERAVKVMQELLAINIAGQIVKAEGYGSQYPIADNSTMEGRALNRRVSCRIVSIKK